VLKARLADWQAQVAARAEIDKTLTAINGEINKLEALIASQGTVLTESQTRLESLNKEHEAACSERKALYSDKHPDAEENRLSLAAAGAEETEKQAAARNSELQQRLTAQRTHVDTLKQRIDLRETELKHALKAFLAALTAAGFADEHQFLAARLTKEQREALSARAKELHDAQTDLKARQNDRATRYAAEIARQVTDKPLAELESQAQDYSDRLKGRRGDIAALLHRLGEHAAAKDRVKEKRTALEAHKITCGRWERLHALIGSADGKKYRTFAQGLTFELMVSHANRQLEKMTDRYLLIRDHVEPLELNVVDNYQAGEIRSTRNLSGGESFIVSLALALGLSRMASRKVRVDSLFLDEGFGTLDEDALETALETLSELRQDNKLIGVISHVPALKERISTQIAVTPESGGRSRLTGPGCALVSG
jgi:exonuclease SbcC